jgi:hypothetical protein
MVCAPMVRREELCRQLRSRFLAFMRRRREPASDNDPTSVSCIPQRLAACRNHARQRSFN